MPTRADEQGGLAGAVAAHEGDGLAGGDGEVDAAEGLDAAAADAGAGVDRRPGAVSGRVGGSASGARPAVAEPPERAGRRGVPGAGTGASDRRPRPAARPRACVCRCARPGRGWDAARQRARAGEAPAVRPAAGVADRQGQRGPARQAAQGDHRRVDRGDGHDLGRGARGRGPRPGPGSSTTWSAYWTTRSSRCSAIRTVVPRSWTSRWSTARTSSAAAGSSADVGSSRTSTRGCGVRTEPIATRCCWPPESVAIGRSRSSARPSRSRVSSTRRRITVRGEAQRLHAVGELVLDGVRHEVRERVLAHRADHVGEFARLVRAGVPAGRP